MDKVKPSNLLIKLIAIIAVFSVLAPHAKANMAPTYYLNLRIHDNGVVRSDPFMGINILSCENAENENECEESFSTSLMTVFPYCVRGNCSYHFWTLPVKFKVSYKSTPLSKPIVSNMVDRSGGRSDGINRYYTLSISGDRANIKPSTTKFPNLATTFISTAIFTLLIEAFVLYFFIKKFNYPKRLYIALLVGNLITRPLVWLGEQWFYKFGLFLGWVPMILLEFWIFFLWFKKHGIDYAEKISSKPFRLYLTLIVQGLLLSLPLLAFRDSLDQALLFFAIFMLPIVGIQLAIAHFKIKAQTRNNQVVNKLYWLIIFFASCIFILSYMYIMTMLFVHTTVIGRLPEIFFYLQLDTIIIEAVIYYLWSRKEKFPFNNLLNLSIAQNLTSLLFGGLLFTLLSYL